MLVPKSCAIAAITNVSRKKSKASSAQPRKQATNVLRWSRSSNLKSRTASMAQSTNCHVKRSRDFSSWRMPKLGRLFQAAQCEGRALTSQLPARERNRTVGLLQLRLHPEARGKTGNARHVISQ